MKIGRKLILRYIGVTATVFSLFTLAIYYFAQRINERSFFHFLADDAATKASYFLSEPANAIVMKSLYNNNRRFLGEPQVAIYSRDKRLLYHDAPKGDILQETTSGLLEDILRHKKVEISTDKYQVVGIIYSYQGDDYIVTATAYARYGNERIAELTTLMLILWLCGLLVIAIVGCLLSRSTLTPLNRIIKKMDAITGSNLDARLEVENPNDELGALAKTFNQMLDRLEKSFDDQKLFVGHIAHELRTPLAALTAELEVSLLRAERSGAEYRAVIGNALEDARWLGRLITGLLDLAKADYRPDRIVMENIRLDELLLDAREIVLKTNPDYTVSLMFDRQAEDENEITIRGNTYLLRIAFINLIENNCKFSENHTSHVHISAHEKAVTVRFSDTGVGISGEDMDKIFGSFYRGENAAQIKGQGLGMALAQKIIRLHKGSITVESQVGKGTVFTTEIPHI